MNPKSKSKLFNTKDLLIQSNYNEIFLPNLSNSSKNKRIKLNMKHQYKRKKIQYFPIATAESLNGKPTIYLAAEENENENNKEIYNTDININNKRNIDKPINLRKRDKRESKTERKENKTIFSKKYNKKINYLSHSHSVDNYLDFDNKLFSSFQNDLENSQIFDGSFINGLKSLKRRNNLKSAIEKYKRFKTLGRLKINSYLNNAFSNKFDFNNNKSKEKINSYDENNNKIIEEEKENENEKESENELNEKNWKLKERGEKEVNKIKIKNIINISNLNNTLQIAPNKKKYIKINSNLKNISTILNDKLKNIKNQIKQNNTSKNNLEKSPQVLVRQIIREEKYIIDENGKEKILGVSQSFLPKKINIKKLEKMNDLNFRNNNNNNIVDKNEKFKLNNNNGNTIFSHRKLIKMNSQSLFNEKNKKNLMTLSSISSNTNKSINSHILDILKKKPKPIIIKKSQNKLEKNTNLNKADEKKILNLSKSYIIVNKEKNHKILNKNNNNSNKNHTYHEISSFSGRKGKPNINSIKNCCYNKKLIINNSTSQINPINKYSYSKEKNINGIASPYSIKTNNEKKVFNNQNKNNYNTERQHNNYSIHEIIEINNNRKKYNNKEYKNSNNIYIDTSPSKYNNYYTFQRNNSNKSHYIEYKNGFCNKNNYYIKNNY